MAGADGGSNDGLFLRASENEMGRERWRVRGKESEGRRQSSEWTVKAKGVNEKREKEISAIQET